MEKDQRGSAPQTAEADTTTTTTPPATPLATPGVCDEVAALLEHHPAAAEERCFLEGHREELARLAQQLLRGLGYRASADCLRAESGFSEEAPAVVLLKRDILRGDWDAARLAIVGGGGGGTPGNQPECCCCCPQHAPPAQPPTVHPTGGTPEAACRLQYLCARQRYLEQLSAGDKPGALRTLQGEVTPRCDDPRELHDLTVLLAGSGVVTQQGISVVPGWPGVEAGRIALARDLHRFLGGAEALQANRLAALLRQSQELQRERCLALNDMGEAHSLLEDYRGDRAALPRHATASLRAHCDEVWVVAFSASGTRVASASRDGCVAIHDITGLCHATLHRSASPGRGRQQQQQHHRDPSATTNGWGGAPPRSSSSNGGGAVRPAVVARFQAHGEAVSSLAFSPDDTMLLTASPDRSVRIWRLQQDVGDEEEEEEGRDGEKGKGGASVVPELVLTFARHVDLVSAAAWLPDGVHFVSAGVDRRMFMAHHRTGEVLREWSVSRVLDLAVSRDGHDLITVDSEKRITCYNLRTPHYGVLAVSPYPPPTEACIATSAVVTPPSSAANTTTPQLRRRVPVARRVFCKAVVRLADTEAAQQGQGGGSAPTAPPAEPQQVLGGGGRSGSRSAPGVEGASGLPAPHQTRQAAQPPLPAAGEHRHHHHRRQQQQQQQQGMRQAHPTHAPPAAHGSGGSSSSLLVGGAGGLLPHHLVLLAQQQQHHGGAGGSSTLDARPAYTAPSRRGGGGGGGGGAAAPDDAGVGVGGGAFYSLHYYFVQDDSGSSDASGGAAQGSGPHHTQGSRSGSEGSAVGDADGKDASLRGAPPLPPDPVVPGDPIRWVMEEVDSLTSCALSRCGGLLLCGVSVKEGRGYFSLYDVAAQRRVQRYLGARQAKYVVRSGFGGRAENFVVAGSEDGKVLLFNRKTGQHIESLVAHVRVTNCVAWNPIYPHVLASCSDDGTVRLWSTLPAEEDDGQQHNHTASNGTSGRAVDGQLVDPLRHCGTADPSASGAEASSADAENHQAEDEEEEEEEEAESDGDADLEEDFDDEMSE